LSAHAGEILSSGPRGWRWFGYTQATLPSAYCNLEDAAAQAGWVSFAKVASIFTQPLADARQHMTLKKHLVASLT
jgi:hypothetical protein